MSMCCILCATVAPKKKIPRSIAQSIPISGAHPEDVLYNLWTSKVCSNDQNWLVVSTPLKNISQLGWLFPIHGKIKKCSKPPTRYTVWSHPILSQTQKSWKWRYQTQLSFARWINRATPPNTGGARPKKCWDHMKQRPSQRFDGHSCLLVGVCE